MPWQSPPPNVVLENVCESFGQRACLFGDCVANAVTNRSTCVCHYGYTHDVLWQRLENCASPGEYWSLVVHVTNILCGIVALATMYLYYRDLRGGALRSMVSLGITVTSFIFASVVFLAQGFGGRAYYVFNALAVCGFAMSLAYFSDTLWGITQQALKMSNNAKRNDRLMVMIRYCFFGSFMWLGVPMWLGCFYVLSLGDETDPHYDVVSGNIAWTLPYPLMELHNFVFFPAFLTMSRYLISVIDESIARKRSANNNVESASTTLMIVRLQETRRRILLFTIGAAGIAAPCEFVLFVVLLPALYFLKIPGMWFVLGLEYAVVNCVVALILITLRTRKSRIKKMMEAELMASLGGVDGNKGVAGEAGMKMMMSPEARVVPSSTSDQQQQGAPIDDHNNLNSVTPTSSNPKSARNMVAVAVAPASSPAPDEMSSSFTASANQVVTPASSFSPP